MVVFPVSGRGAGIHDEVAVQPAGTAVAAVAVAVVGRPQVVPDLVREGDLRHFLRGNIAKWARKPRMQNSINRGYVLHGSMSIDQIHTEQCKN